MHCSGETCEANHWGMAFEGGSPCGEDLSLDPECDLLNDEINKDKSLHSDQATDWIIIYELSCSLLSRSKDLWFFAYGIISVYHTKSIHDCVAGIDSLIELMSAQWQSLHPSLKRPKRRIASLKWLCDKFHSIADNTAFLNVASQDINALNDAFVRLQEKIDSLLPDNDLNFKSILHAQLSGSRQEVAPDREHSAAAVSKAAASASKHFAQPLGTTLEEIEKRAIIPAAILPQVVRTINENARQFGDHLLAINKEDERAYLLHRVATWGTLLQLPPSDANGLTQISCPIPPDMAATYEAGVNDKRYSEILPQIERAASKAPFWLDGQYMVVKCLEGLSATLPAFSVKHAMAQLVKRFPEILSLKFKDGRPFASSKTSTWINSFLPAVTGAGFLGSSSDTPSPDAAQADETDLLQKAIDVSLESDFNAGLDVLGQVQPGKNRRFFRHSILKARYCSAAGHPHAATLILNSLIEKLKIWDLLDWEPELTAEAVSLLLSLPPKQKEPNDELQALLHTISLETAISAKRA